MLKLTLGVILAAMFGVASTLTSVTCASPGAAYAVAATDCGALGTNGYARASVSSSVTLPSSATQAANIQLSSTVTALETTFRGIATSATATASADVGLIFDTTGAARNGLLELTFNQTAYTRAVDGIISQSLAIGPANPILGGSAQTIWIPIQLGSEFGFEYKQSVSALGNAFTGLTSGSIGADISLLAFESNGTTPVELFDPPGILSPSLFTPEPASFGIFIAGLCGLGLLRKKRIN